MDDLAAAAGVARRTIYNQFASKQEIFPEMLLRVSGQLETAFPPGIETRGDVEDVVRLIARAILDLHGRPRYLGFLRMVAADSRRFPWIGEAFAAIPVEHRRRGAARWVHWPAISPPWLVASLGAFTGTLRIGDRLRVLRLLAAGFAVASVLGILWATNTWPGMTALGQSETNVTTEPWSAVEWIADADLTRASFYWDSVPHCRNPPSACQVRGRAIEHHRCRSDRRWADR